MSSRRVIGMGKQGGYKDLGVNIFILVKLVTFNMVVFIPDVFLVTFSMLVKEETGFYFSEHPT